MAYFFNEEYKKCSCGNLRFEIKKTALITTEGKEVENKIEYFCTECGKKLKD